MLARPWHWRVLRHLKSFPGGSESKESAYNAGGLGSVPGSGRSPGGGSENPLQYSGRENSMDRRAWWATVHGITKRNLKGIGSPFSNALSMLNKSKTKQALKNKDNLKGLWLRQAQEWRCIPETDSHKVPCLSHRSFPAMLISRSQPVLRI